MGICHSTAHLRVALEGRSSRSIFPVDTVWGDLLLTCSYRMRGGLGLECNHSRARQGQRQCSEICISSGHCVVTTRYSKWTYWHCRCTPRLCGKGNSSVRFPLANHFLPWLAFFKCLHRNTQRFAAQFFWSPRTNPKSNIISSSSLFNTENVCLSQDPHGTEWGMLLCASNSVIRMAIPERLFVSWSLMKQKL